MLSGFNSNLKKNEGITWTMQQFWGMIVKKMIHSWRNRTVTLIQLILPVVFTIMALSTEKSIPKIEDEPSLTLDLTAFQNIKTIYSQSATPNILASDLLSNYTNVFTRLGYDVESTGSKVMDDYVVSQAQSMGISTFKKQYIVAGDFETNNTLVNVTSYFNGQPFHSVAISLAYMMDSFLKYFTDDTYSITTTNFPLPRPIDETSRGIGYAHGERVLLLRFVYFLEWLFYRRVLSCS